MGFQRARIFFCDLRAIVCSYRFRDDLFHDIGYENLVFSSFDRSAV